MNSKSKCPSTAWVRSICPSCGSAIRPLLFAIAFFLPATTNAFLDLDKAQVERLDNGLTLIILEDRSFPVVSVHMLYRVGARNETAGATGLAHFLEHMAFRDSENFPGTGLVSSIYAAGGEWHGYTWLDSTNYFATAPKADLDLLLRIEADRMARLLIPAEDIEAERGAVLTELHSYENDPASVLLDNLMYLTFLAHPYRNNTIGWESDVANISHADAVAFYKAHYHPGNAVLAVVGDVDAGAVRALVENYFAALPGRPMTPLPHTVEPPQTGERRMRLTGDLDRRHFKIAWRAPSSNHPDFATMLVVQELLGGGSGVSFLQNDWGTPVRDGSALANAAGGMLDDLTTWYPPSAQDYVFVISGDLPLTVSETDAEQAIGTALSQLGERLAVPTDSLDAEVARARQSVLRELTFDVQTTEDAAHQLAYFAGLGALDALADLSDSLAQVSAADVSRVVETWLRPEQRNIAWYGPAPKAMAGAQDAAPPEAEPARSTNLSTSARASSRVGSGSDPGAMPAPEAESGRVPAPSANLIPGGTRLGDHAALPVLKHLNNGLPVILQQSPLSPTITLRVITPLGEFPDDAPALPHQPIRGVNTLDFFLLPGELKATAEKARTALDAAIPGRGTPPLAATDPSEVLESYFVDSLGVDLGLSRIPSGIPSGAPGGSRLGPMLIVVTGAIDEAKTLEAFESGFGHLPAAPFEAPPAVAASGRMDIESTLPAPVAQEQLGYIVRAPAPGDPAAAAWQMALYILTHGYEGRLGVEAITRRGLVYYVDSAHGTDGTNGWMTLRIGVDPDKQPAMKALLREELQRLIAEPPTQEEVDEARQHLLGRRISAAQSNPELADFLALEWFAGQALPSDAEWMRRINGVSREDVISVLPAFTAGSIIAVRSP